MAEQMMKTKYLSKKVDEVDLKANIGIALGATSIGVGSKALSFASKGSSTAGRLLTNTFSDIAEHASNGTGFVLGDGSHLPISSTPFSLTNEVTKTALTPIIEWSETFYTPFDSIPFEDELDDPSKQVIMLDAALDLCNRFRSSLKPTFKALATRINELTNENDNVSNQLKEYINKSELTRKYSKLH